jgi:hypothetical protein
VEDQAVFAGPPPVLLLSRDFAELVKRLQPGRKEDATLPLPLGAGQVVIVRDAATRDALLATVPFCGLGDLVVTVRNTKGLEWTDVLLVNFFSSSAAALGKKGMPAWRSLLNLLDLGLAGVASTGHAIGYSPGKPSLRVPTLDSLRNALPLAFETEIKMLYVALTRARTRLWLWEGGIPGSSAPSCIDACHAPFTFLQRAVLVSAVSAGTADIEPFVA